MPPTEENPQRICLACRTFKPRNELFRLTVNWKSGEIIANGSPSGRDAILGRSAYLCYREECAQQALKGKLKSALQGGRGRKDKPKRKIAWPLEPGLIHTLTSTCTER